MFSLSRMYRGVRGGWAFTRTPGLRGYSTGNGLKPKRLVWPFAAGGVVTLYVYDKYYNSSTYYRSWKAIYTLTKIAVKYKFCDINNDLHEWGSESLYRLLVENKGLYIKFGQAIANQGTVFPLPYQKRLSLLYDEAPCDTWEVTDNTLKKELGENYEHDIFDTIDHEPMATASIAQVHKARLKNGDDVAVKIQHDYLQQQMGSDLMVYRGTVKMYEFLFDMPMDFYSEYICNQMTLETKFLHELENSEKLAKFIDNDSSAKRLRIYVPKTYREFSTEKVLFTEWVNGTSLIDKQKLIDKKYDLGVIMHQFINIFAKQIFTYGFVHSDPHPGNLLVNLDKYGKQQLVILDHGAYVELNPKFKSEYAQLWECLFSFDQSGIKRIGESWGINSVDTFATLIQLKPVNLNSERKKVNSKELMKNFLGDTSKFPLDLIFLGKTMRIIQTTNKAMGSPINRINTLTNEAVNSLIHETSFNIQFLHLLTMKCSLFISSVVFWWFRIKQILLGDKFGDKHLGLEDYLEEYLATAAKDFYLDMYENF